MDVPVQKSSNTPCPVAQTVALIGGKWKPYLVFNLMLGAKRFSELQRIMPKISDRMLTRSLRELEQDGLIQRTVHAEVPVKVVYSLSSDGRSLVPILESMVEWTKKRGALAAE